MLDHRRMRAAAAGRNLLVMGTNAVVPGATLPGVAPEAAVPTPRHEPDALRAFVALLAVVVVPFAALADPAGPLPTVALPTVVLAAGGAMFVVWARRPQLPPLLFTAVVLACVLTAKTISGDLDGALFLVTLLVIAVAGWERSGPVLILVGAAALGTPVLIELLRPGDVDVPTWLLGIALPGVIGWLFRRQEDLTAQLEADRRERGARAVADERRRIARDVHDLVAHGLAAVLLQVSSARHVLRRDPDEAEVALRSAEEVGRRNLAELRATVALLRSADEPAGAALPGLEQLPRLVAEARTAGLVVSYRPADDLHRVPAAAGLTLYRVAQEALVNARRYAPQSDTVVATRTEPGTVELTVHSHAPLPIPRDRGRPGYGLVGMRERAVAAGGELHAGPVPDGWLVRCALPLGGHPAGRRAPGPPTLGGAAPADTP